MSIATLQRGTCIRVVAAFQEQQWGRIFHRPSIVIGRATGAGKPDIDLSSDLNVSRRHARVWTEQDVCWIEDLGSKFGTVVDGAVIGPGEKAPLKPESTVQLGDTVLRVAWTRDGQPASLLSPTVIESDVEVCEVLKASEVLDWSTVPDAVPRQSQLLQITAELNRQQTVEDFTSCLVTRAVQWLRGSRGTLLMVEASGADLWIDAFLAEADPVVRESLARRAASERSALMWHRATEDPTRPRTRSESGAYVPLVHGERVLAVVCIDDCTDLGGFSKLDLENLIALAQQAAGVLFNLQVVAQQARSLAALKRLAPAFAPEARAALLADPKRFEPEGVVSEVTILCAELRCFEGVTDTAAQMDWQRVLVPMLAPVAACDGTLLSVLGAQVLVAFGCPGEDGAPCDKAMRLATLMQSALWTENEHRAAVGAAPLGLALAVDCGTAWHGFVGDAEFHHFAVLGKPTHGATRLASAAFAGDFLISSQAFRRLHNSVRAEKITIQEWDPLESTCRHASLSIL